MEAILNASTKRRHMERFVIYIKNGVYNEYVQVSSEMKNIVMIGDGINNTIITGNRSHGENFTTFNCATFCT
ncbi:hypothetical protein HYC85_013555 [Camellia sinensis]|uniref:Pectinesterase catalytic domain-containing protein n=1 Tax=Camellia sinensis TaxID=4442 RepID=A0A7J7H792_CAMSI|nr:hypothetical protein HYC85_013555 [Camellia sinensis]